MPKIVAVSDLHLDWKTRGFERGRDVLAQLRLAVEYASDVGADLFACLGDVFDGHDPDERAWTLLGALQDEFRGLECPAIIVAGNHDVVDRAGCHSAVWPLRNDGGYGRHAVFVAEGVDTYPFPDFSVVTVPHVSRAHIKAAIAVTPQEYLDAAAAHEIALDGKWRAQMPLVALCHLEVEGARPGAEVDMVAGERLEIPKVIRESPEVTVVLCGHIHEAQDVPRFPGGEVPAGTSAGWDPQIHVVGTLERLTLSEAGQPKSFLELEV